MEALRLPTTRPMRLAPQAKATLAPKSVVEHASWYDPRMNGHKTATGERFSSHQMTAAAKGVPLGSNVVVTNLKNGRSVQVRINDCGHFKPGRELDLSKSAAHKIALIHDATAPIKSTVVSTPPGANLKARIIFRRPRSKGFWHKASLMPSP
jgi:rare lipoprotein A (peptidoglycan hydrolase)